MTDYQQFLTFDELPDGSLIARLTLRFPNGTERRFASEFRVGDGERAAREFAEREGGSLPARVGAAIESAAPKKGEHPADWWWRVSDQARHGKKVTDAKARAAWWNALGRSTRSSVRAMQVEAPQSARTVKQIEAWWSALGKKRRGLARERHGGTGGGVLADIVSTVKDIDRAIDDSPLGKAAQVALPALALGRWSVKNPEAAISFVPGGSSAATALKTGAKLLPAAKKLAAGKVMEAAAKSLDATGDSALGAGASKALKLASELSYARAADTLGASKAADAFRASARAALGGVSSSVARDAMQLADKTSANIEKLAHGPAKKSKAVLPRAVLDAARLGRIKSNRPGVVSSAELAAAMRAGRVYFVRSAS